MLFISSITPRISCLVVVPKLNVAKKLKISVAKILIKKIQFKIIHQIISHGKIHFVNDASSIWGFQYIFIARSQATWIQTTFITNRFEHYTITYMDFPHTVRTSLNKYKDTHFLSFKIVLCQK